MSASLIGPTSTAGLTSPRAGERRLGDLVGRGAAAWALVGIPEDIGVRANFGRGGTAAMWPAFLRRFLAMPAPESMGSGVVAVAGEVAVANLQAESVRLNAAVPADLARLREMTAKVDELVSDALAGVLRGPSIPVVIGGGHNNGLGVSRALRQVNGCAHAVINCDAHADMRDMEGRHSGNPFTYAQHECSLAKYAVIGFSPLGASPAVLKRLDGRSASAWSVDDIHADRLSIAAAASQARQFIGEGPWSLEIDLDCVAGLPCSATSASGFSGGQLRALVRAVVAGQRPPAAVHICEGIPQPETHNDPGPRLAAELVMDIIASAGPR